MPASNFQLPNKPIHHYENVRLSDAVDVTQYRKRGTFAEGPVGGQGIASLPTKKNFSSSAIAQMQERAERRLKEQREEYNLKARELKQQSTARKTAAKR